MTKTPAPVAVVSFYRFVEIADPDRLCAKLQALCDGLAILGTILFSSLGSQLADRLPTTIPADVQTQIVNAVVDSAGTAIPGLEARSPEAADAARQAFSDATRYAAFSAAGFLALGLLSTISLGAGARRRDPAPLPVE